MEPLFLSLDDVLAIHSDQIRRYGGARGLRDLGLLESAIGTPAVTFGGRLLHHTLFEMAGAYLFHIARNHPFIDGNKRTALAVALVFLSLNRRRIRAPEEELATLVLGVVAGRVTKADVAVFFARHSAK